MSLEILRPGRAAVRHETKGHKQHQGGQFLYQFHKNSFVYVMRHAPARNPVRRICVRLALEMSPRARWDNHRARDVPQMVRAYRAARTGVATAPRAGLQREKSEGRSAEPVPSRRSGNSPKHGCKATRGGSREEHDQQDYQHESEHWALPPGSHWMRANPRPDRISPILADNVRGGNRVNAVAEACKTLNTGN